MSALAAITATLVSSRASFTTAVSRLASAWRDGHFAAFHEQTVAPVDVATRRLGTALDEADQAVDAVFRGLREIGGDP